ncbi:hypothetical protein [Streptomyces sp. CBMA29]|uniref:hypothetical protein n=1 Tax=Streptomyces sp. CBMA29 TaxID=1896314 RepID=UPI0016621322|nr:hypothetical protein [Streptomyces sp. CBMA29]MBD0734005.1 hypothetical protein [Streptomyces sp. CBMA29]
MSEMFEFAYDATKDTVLRVKASSREEADAKISELIGSEEEIGIRYPNGVFGYCETINYMPVFFSQEPVKGGADE